jgi:hypothetical protein
VRGGDPEVEIMMEVRVPARLLKVGDKIKWDDKVLTVIDFPKEPITFDAWKDDFGNEISSVTYDPMQDYIGIIKVDPPVGLRSSPYVIFSSWETSTFVVVAASGEEVAKRICDELDGFDTSVRKYIACVYCQVCGERACRRHR